MTGAEIITFYLEQFERVDPTILRLRLRAQRNCQRTVSFVWVYRPWNWTLVYWTDTIPAGQDYLFLPTQRLVEGPLGGIFVDPSLQRPIKYVDPSVFNQVKYGRPTVAGVPRIYTTGIDQNDGGEKKVVFWPTPAVDTNVTEAFKRSAPTILDSEGADPSSGNSLLEMIPEQWHLPVIYEGMVWHGMRDKGNAQSVSEQKEIFMAGLARMAVEESPEWNKMRPLVAAGR